MKITWKRMIYCYHHSQKPACIGSWTYMYPLLIYHDLPEMLFFARVLVPASTHSHNRNTNWNMPRRFSETLQRKGSDFHTHCVHIVYTLCPFIVSCSLLFLSCPWMPRMIIWADPASNPFRNWYGHFMAAPSSFPVAEVLSAGLLWVRGTLASLSPHSSSEPDRVAADLQYGL